MSNPIVTSMKSLAARIRALFSRDESQHAGKSQLTLFHGIRHSVKPMVLGVLAVSAVVVLALHPPVDVIEPGEMGLRTNRLTGTVTPYREGTVFQVPGLHVMRHVSLREQTFLVGNGQDNAFQSMEGLSLGLDLAVRFALDGNEITARAARLPSNIEAEWVRPSVEGVVHKALSKHTVREIFSSKRTEIAQAIENELRAKLTQDGVLLKSVQLGKVHLPNDYKKGMESLLAEELASEKMRFTIELKAKQVRERELETEAERVRREKLAQAAAQEQVIAAKGQEEAMKHIIPFKEKQIAQRQLEAEAQKQARIRNAEGDAQARRIEAAGEAESRQKLADAEAYRQDRLGKVATDQMAREGVLLTKHPLLVQKAMVDKLSDKVSVIVAPAGVDGQFLGAAIAGNTPRIAHAAEVADAERSN